MQLTDCATSENVNFSCAKKGYNSIIIHIEFEFPAPMILLNKELNRVSFVCDSNKEMQRLSTGFLHTFFLAKKKKG